MKKRFGFFAFLSIGILCLMGGGILNSCKHSSSSGPAELDLAMYSDKKNTKEIDEISYIIGEESPSFYVQSVNYPNKNQIELDEATWELGNKDGELDVDDDISFTYKKTNKNYKVVLNSIPQSSGSYDFTLFFSVENGQEDSLEFTVKVSKKTEGGEIVSGAAPEITAHPLDASDKEQVKLEVKARVPNDSDAVITYQWYTADGKSIEGATNDSYEAKETGAYYVKVTANGVTVQSKTANVVIGSYVTIPTHTINTIDPYKIEDGILKVPEPSKAVLSIEIKVNGSAREADSYQWCKVGESSGNDVMITGATSKNYTPSESDVVSAFAGYYCKFSVDGQTYHSDTVKVVEKDIKITFTKDLASSSYTGIPLSVKAETDVPCNLTYQWYTTSVDSDGDEPIGANGESYTPNKPDRYFCRVIATSKAFPTKQITKDSATCDVVEKTASDPDIPGNVKISGNENISLKVGDKLELSVDHSFVNGTPSYQWKKGGNEISGATSSTYTKNSVATSDAGLYSCEVFNTLEGKTVSATSNSVTVTVTGNGSSTGSGNGSFDFN